MGTDLSMGRPRYTGPDRSSVSARARLDTIHPIQPLKHGTTARQIIRFKMGYVSHIKDVSHSEGYPDRLTSNSHA